MANFLVGMSHPKVPASLLDALLEYEAHVRTTLPDKKADATMAQIRTALWRYTLPGWGGVYPQGQRLSQAEYDEGLKLLRQLPFARLKETSEVQERLFEQLAVAGNSRRNYRWALNQFIEWCQQQSWFEADFEATRRSPARNRERKRSANDVRVTSRRKRAYQLTEAERPEALRQELDLFCQSLVGAGRDDKELKGVSRQTAQGYLNQVVRILGWLHTDQQVPLQELSLRRLVEEEAESVAELVQAYLQWLKRPEQENGADLREATASPNTDLRVINTWLAVARFLACQDETSLEQETQKSSVTIAALKALRKQIQATLKHYQPVSDETKKRLEWHEFLDLVEKLREECVPRFQQSTQSKQGGATLGPRRSLTAIAQSYQRFLLAALLAYIPPQRPQVLRDLSISHGLISELPPRSQARFDEESVLYQEQDAWWIKIVDQRTRHPSSHYLVFVPNLEYADGRCFYQYLEEWLLHYAYQTIQGQPVEVPGLRSCFKPNHSRLFTMTNGQPYQNAPTFIKLLRYSAYRITGKATDFHTVRRVYAEYLRSKERSGSESEHFIRPVEDEGVLDTATSFDSDEEYAFNLADWKKAATIAQEFLNQLA